MMKHVVKQNARKDILDRADSSPTMAPANLGMCVLTNMIKTMNLNQLEKLEAAKAA